MYLNKVNVFESRLKGAADVPTVRTGSFFSAARPLDSFHIMLLFEINSNCMMQTTPPLFSFLLSCSSSCFPAIDPLLASSYY